MDILNNIVAVIAGGLLFASIAWVAYVINTDPVEGEGALIFLIIMFIIGAVGAALTL